MLSHIEKQSKKAKTKHTANSDTYSHIIAKGALGRLFFLSAYYILYCFRAQNRVNLEMKGRPGEQDCSVRSRKARSWETKHPAAQHAEDITYM